MMKKTILQNSSAVGGIPIAISPHPITRKPNTNNMIPITIKAATNFALIMQSRCIKSQSNSQQRAQKVNKQHKRGESPI